MKLKLGLIALAFAGSALAQTQGVSKNEIVIGTIKDLSGPVVVYSKPVVNGMKMRVDEINAEGGIHGRKLKLIVEDSGYDPKKGVLAQQKLIQRDKVFAMLGTLGGFVYPILFGYLLNVSGIWTTNWLLLAGVALVCLRWFRATVRRVGSTARPVPAIYRASSAREQG